MSNNYSCVATLVMDPETLTIKDKAATKIRCAVKATSKKHTDRFFNMLCMGYDAETAGRLAKGDRIFVSGPLEQEEYTSKKQKGAMVKADVMGFGARILKVLHSPTFFGGKPAPAEGAEDFGPPDPPAAPGSGPLDGLDF